MRKIAYSLSEAADLTDLCLTSIKAAVRAGDLQAVKAGRRTLITAESLESWIQALPKVRPSASRVEE